MKTTLISHLLQVAARKSAGAVTRVSDSTSSDSFYLDAMNIAAETYSSSLARLGFCYRTIKTAHEIRRQSALPDDFHEDSPDDSIMGIVTIHLQSVGTFCWQSVRYALLSLRRGFRLPVVGDGLSFARLASVGVVLIVVASVWTLSDNPDDAEYRGVEPADSTQVAGEQTPAPAQISLSVLMLKALIEDAGFSEHVEIEATESSIEIDARLSAVQLETWNNKVLNEYQQRGGSVALLNQKFDKLLPTKSITPQHQ